MLRSPDLERQELNRRLGLWKESLVPPLPYWEGADELSGLNAKVTAQRPL